MLIDYSTPEGKLRMRLGDISDIPYLPSSVYNAVYAEEGNNLNRAVVSCGKMILAQMSYKTHRKLGLQLEVFGGDAFKQMKEFLILTVKDPAFMTMAPIPYGASGTTTDPLIQFMHDWNKGCYTGTESQQLAIDGAISPNDGSLYGPLGSLSTTSGQLDNGWQLP